ncbi:MAG: chemotaxis protein CheX [Sedimentisphaerales bacterium]|nr:chemotaxis protein CheX [Sedimentisphaerales bacterium]
MATTDTNGIVTEALSLALEKMAFLDVSPWEESIPISEPILIGKIGFTGPICGTLQIAAGGKFAALLADNMGVLEQANKEQCNDAMQELVNVTTGLVLPMLLTESTDVFDVTVPHVSSLQGVREWTQWTQRDDTVLVHVDNHPIAVRLTLTE